MSSNTRQQTCPTDILKMSLRYLWFWKNVLITSLRHLMSWFWTCYLGSFLEKRKRSFFRWDYKAQASFRAHSAVAKTDPRQSPSLRQKAKGVVPYDEAVLHTLLPFTFRPPTPGGTRYFRSRNILRCEIDRERGREWQIASTRVLLDFSLLEADENSPLDLPINSVLITSARLNRLCF